MGILIGRNQSVLVFIEKKEERLKPKRMFVKPLPHLDPLSGLTCMARDRSESLDLDATEKTDAASPFR